MQCLWGWHIYVDHTLLPFREDGSDFKYLKAYWNRFKKNIKLQKVKTITVKLVADVSYAAYYESDAMPDPDF